MNIPCLEMVVVKMIMIRTNLSLVDFSVDLQVININLHQVN